MTGPFQQRLSLNTRHALVCGASRGIGRAAALTLASQGAEVTVLARTQDALVELVGELQEAGAPAAQALVADLDEHEALEQRVEFLIRRNPVHVLVNNTGGPKGGPLLEAGAEQLLAAFERHVLSAHLLVRLVLPGMRDVGYGRIINVLSTSVREPIPNLGVSNTIRAAMSGWAKTLSGELPPGITINNVLPGFTTTERLAELASDAAQRRGTTAEKIEEGWCAMIPEGRLADPEETASAIGFLASPAASYVRGVSLAVDGGRMRSI